MQLFFDNRKYEYIATSQLNYFHTLSLGGMLKINMHFNNLPNPFSIGIGGGVKIPFHYTEVLTYDNKKTAIYQHNYMDIKTLYKYPFIPYIKLTLDGYLYQKPKMALLLSVFLSYDFGMEYDPNVYNSDVISPNTFYGSLLKYKKLGFSSISLGASVGLYIGRENPKL